MAKDVKKATEDIQARVSELAYLMWESAGRQYGMAMDYWLAAERQIMNSMTAVTDTVTGKADHRIEQIGGVGPGYAKKLAQVGIKISGELLRECASPKGRSSIAEKAGVPAAKLLKWVNMADLMCIDGVDGEQAELLEAAGADTVKELRNRKPDNLAAKMAEVNKEKKLTRKVPTVEQVSAWVDQAKAMDPVITH